MSSLTIFIIGIACFALGAIVGAALHKIFASDQNKTRNLEKLLHQKQDEVKNYQHEVQKHFTETSHLLKQLAESYRDVHNHLATGAQKLCDDDSSMPIMQQLPELETITNVQIDESRNIVPPLDYAPKSTPYDRGTLNEDYDLEKIKLEEKPINDTAKAGDKVTRKMADRNSTPA